MSISGFLAIELFATSFFSSGLLGFVILEERILVDLNQAASQILGCPKEEILGQPVANYTKGSFPKLSKEKTFPEVKWSFLLSMGMNCAYDHSLKTNKESSQAVLVRANAQTHASSTQGISNDLIAFFESDIPGMTFFDLNLELIKVNKIGLKILHHQIKSLSGKSWKKVLLSSLVPSNMVQDELLNWLNSAPHKKNLHTKTQNRKEDQLHLEISFDPISLTSSVGYIGTIREPACNNQLRNSESVIKDHHSPLGIVECDAQFKITRWYAQCEEIFKRKAYEDIGKDHLNLRLIDGEDLDPPKKVIEEIRSASVSCEHLQHRNDTKYDQMIYCYWYHGSIPNKYAPVSSFLYLVEDITPTSQREDQTEKSELLQRSFFEHTSNFIFIRSLEGSFLDANQNAAKGMSYTFEELKRMRLLDIFRFKNQKNPLWSKENFRNNKRALATEGIFWEEGSTLHAEIRSQVIETELLTLVRDITDYKEATFQLKQNKGLLCTTGQISKVGGWKHHASTGSIQLEPGCPIYERVVKVTAIAMRKWLTQFSEEHMGRVSRLIEATHEKMPPFDEEFKLTMNNQHPFVRIVGYPMKDSSQGFRLKGIGQDITESKIASQQIVVKKSRSDKFINGLPGVFYILHEDGKFLRWDKNFEVVPGYSSPQVSLLHRTGLVDPSVKEVNLNTIKTTIEKDSHPLTAEFISKNSTITPYFFNGLNNTIANNASLAWP